MVYLGQDSSNPDVNERRPLTNYPIGPIAGCVGPRITRVPLDLDFRICVVGPPQGGKSALTISFVQNHFIEEYDPTIEDSFRHTIIVDDISFILTILDTAGQEEYSAMRDQYMRVCQGFLLVFSLTDRESFEKVQDYITLIYKLKDSTSVPIIIAANKYDLAFEQDVSNEEVAQLGNEKNIICFLTSAKDRYNVEECFAQLVREIERHQIIPTQKPKSTCSLM